MRVLAVAPTCDGTDVGEAWVAHQWVRELALRHEVTLLTYHKRGRPPARGQLPDVRTIEWTEPPLLGRAERLNSLVKPGYFPFYRAARGWIRESLRLGESFDVAHQISPVAVRYPSPLAGTRIPYVLGPVGGSLDTPLGFRAEDSAPWYMALRSLDALRLRHDPWLRRTYADAGCVLGIAPYVRDLLDTIPLRKFEVMGDTGIPELPMPNEGPPASGPLRLLFVGRLTRTKGVRDAIRALALCPADAAASLDIAGTGYDEDACRSLARELGVASRVVFHGHIPRSEVDMLYRKADVFLFPSYREPGGLAVLEALSFGLPAVVADRGGPAATVTEACGIRVTPSDPEQYPRELAEAIIALSRSADRRVRMARAARVRAQEVGLWSSKAERMTELYAEVSSAAHSNSKGVKSWI